MKLSGGERGGHCVNATTHSLCVHPLRARQISRTDQSASLGGAVTGPATFHHNVKNTDASKLSLNCFFFFYSQHSGARRAHEAAHGDVGVRHPGLVALEAVFVYSGLGQLPDLAGADLLVVPVLSVRHLTAPLPSRPVPVNRAPDSPRARRRYMEHLTPRIMQTRRCGFAVCQSNARLRGREPRQVTSERGGGLRQRKWRRFPSE